MQSLNVPQGLPKTFMVWQGGFVVSDIIFGCDNPIYKPSAVGVTTSHITPVHPTLNCGKAEC